MRTVNREGTPPPRERSDDPPAISRPGENLSRKLLNRGCKAVHGLKCLIPDNLPDIARNKIAEHLSGLDIRGLDENPTPFDDHTAAKRKELMKIGSSNFCSNLSKGTI